MDCSLPGSSVHRIFQARVLDWVAISFSRRSSQPGIELMSLTSPALTMLKPLNTCITTNCGKFLKNWEDHLTYLPRKPAGQEPTEPYMGRQTGSKLGKEYVKAVYCHLAYLTYMESTSWEMPGWMKLKLESRLPGEISITSDMHMTLP